MSFEKKIFLGATVSNLVAALFIFLYSVWMMQLGSSFTPKAFALIFGIVAVAELFLAPFTNIIVSRSVSRGIRRWRTEETSAAERTELFREVQRLPRRKQLEAVLYFSLCSVVLSLLYRLFFDVGFLPVLANVVSCLFGCYIAGQLNLSASVRICSKVAAELVAQGIDDEVVQERKVFGQSYLRMFVLNVVVPIVCTTLLFFSLFLIDYYRNDCNGLSQNQFKQISVVMVINVAMAVLLVLSFFTHISSSSRLLQEAMEHIVSSDIFTVELVSTDVSNEVAYNMYLVNRVVLLFRAILKKVHAIGQRIMEPVRELTGIANETASASFEQAAGVREILATMEENDEQTRDIVGKIVRVTEISEITSWNVTAAFATLKTNLRKMDEIAEANVSTISGIRDLGEKIEGIWKIVDNINDIAEQSRIIAFNAELEASGAGDEGRNFRIVANEIRRLAAGITESVAQIRERVTEIQHSSDNLIVSSESGTEKIREGCQLSSSLEAKFQDIQASSEITVESVVDIKQIIEQQSAAFDQIVATIRQISAGIDNFTASTNTVNTAAASLKAAADRLVNLHSEVGAHDGSRGR